MVSYVDGAGPLHKKPRFVGGGGGGQDEMRDEVQYNTDDIAVDYGEAFPVLSLSIGSLRLSPGAFVLLGLIAAFVFGIFLWLCPSYVFSDVAELLRCFCFFCFRCSSSFVFLRLPNVEKLHCCSRKCTPYRPTCSTLCCSIFIQFKRSAQRVVAHWHSYMLECVARARGNLVE